MLSNLSGELMRRDSKERRKAMEFCVPLFTRSIKIVVRCGESSAEFNLTRFLFGDGKWIAKIHGDDVFR